VRVFFRLERLFPEGKSDTLFGNGFYPAGSKFREMPGKAKVLGRFDDITDVEYSGIRVLGIYRRGGDTFFTQTESEREDVSDSEVSGRGENGSHVLKYPLPISCLLGIHVRRFCRDF
jgi:hypothetical protein